MMLSTQGFKANLSARFFFNRGTIQLFLREFFVRWGGGGGGVKGGLSLFSGCFLNGPKKWSLSVLLKEHG